VLANFVPHSALRVVLLDLARHQENWSDAAGS